MTRDPLRIVLTEDTHSAIKRALRPALRLGASRVAECIAAGLGFGTSAGLGAALRKTEPLVVVADDAAFVGRAARFGVRAAPGLFEQACRVHAKQAGRISGITRSASRAIAVAEELGYRVTEDSDQPGLWVWVRGSDGCDTSFASEREAWLDASREAAGEVMGFHGLSEEDWERALADGTVVRLVQQYAEEAVPDQAPAASVVSRVIMTEDQIRALVEGSVRLADVLPDVAERFVRHCIEAERDRGFGHGTSLWHESAAFFGHRCNCMPCQKDRKAGPAM
jgi:hypothetical protein